MIEMARRDILPAVSAYAVSLTEAFKNKKEIGLGAKFEEDTVRALSDRADAAYTALKELEEDMKKTADIADSSELSMYYKDTVIPVMGKLREAADALETLTSSAYWPYPTYGELLFGVR